MTENFLCTGSRYSSEECFNPVEWVRHTQFAGSHPYCSLCAAKEPDFLVDDSYTDWENLKGRE